MSSYPQLDTPPNPDSDRVAPTAPVTEGMWNNAAGAPIPDGSVVRLDIANDATNARQAIIVSVIADPKWYGIYAGGGSAWAVGTLGTVVRHGPVKALVKGQDDTGGNSAIAVGDLLTVAADGTLVKATTGAGLGLRSDRGVIAQATVAVNSGVAAALQLVIVF